MRALKPAALALAIGVLLGTPCAALSMPLAAPQASPASASGVAARTDQRAQLLAQARAGEAAQRDDLVAGALARLRRIAPDDPDVLGLELRLALRQRQPKRAAELGAALCRAAPAGPACANARVLLRLYGPDADALRRATQQLAMGRSNRALAGFRALFGDAPPDFELATKYWIAAGTVPADRVRAIAALEALDQRYPGNIELRQGLVDMLFRAGDDAQALAWLGKLAGDPRASFAAAQREFDYLSNLPAGRRNAAAWRAFMQRFPDPTWTAKAKAQMATLGQAAAGSARGESARVATTSAPAVRREPGSDRTAIRVAALRKEAQAAVAAHDPHAAEALFGQAHALAPADAGVVRRWTQWQLAAGQGARALVLLRSQPAAMQRELADVVRRAQVSVLEQQAAEARVDGDAALAVTRLRRAHALEPGDPWLVYHLATAERATGAGAAGDRLFEALLAKPAPDADAHYAYALYLAAADRDDAALAALDKVPASAWTAGMRGLAARVRARQRIAKARALHAAGDDVAAERLLLTDATPANRLLAADWARAGGDDARALALYREVLAHDPASADAGLGVVELLLQQGDPAAARRFLRTTPPRPAASDYAARRRLANAWLAVGDARRAVALFAALDRAAPADALTLRDSARALVAAEQPDAALDLYARALAADHLMAAPAVPRDDAALTRATRAEDGDDWLARGLRGDVAALYQAQNPTVTLLHDYAWRSDQTTPGSSDLQRQTTILNATAPVAGGAGFAQLERVRLDAGRFATDATGTQHAAFGACALQWQALADPASAPVPAGCAGVAEAQTGYAVAVGWRGQRWSFDLGHSPSGFAVGHWLGGVAYHGDWSQLGYTLTLSRRPIDSTLLSYAGARDPASGELFGGVTATGLTVNLSHDRGGANGVWAEFQQQALAGRNVPSNWRSVAMAGWYHRLVQRDATEVRAGLTLMYWHYQRDLGQFTLGQAGYYSPQQYASIGVPFRVAHRSGNWSLDLDASVGWSWARFDATGLYPADVVTRVLGAAADPTDYRLVRGALAQPGSGSTGIGARLAASVERRLSSHWVLGGRVSYYHSQDYAPSDAMLYLRYTFHRWEGDLPLPVEPVASAADFK